MSNLRTLLISLTALSLVAAACGSDGDSGPGEIPVDRDDLGSESIASTPATEAPDDSSDGVLRPGLQVTSVDFTTGVAVITNLGEREHRPHRPLDLQPAELRRLPPRVLAPDESVEASLGGFPAGGGEVAVYTSNSFGDATAISTYVGWGSGGGRQPVAEQAGIWSGDPVQPAGDTITLTGEPGSAGGWG